MKRKYRANRINVKSQWKWEIRWNVALFSEREISQLLTIINQRAENVLLLF